MTERSTHEGLAYGACGTGPTVVAVHGGLGLDHHYLEPLITDWSEFARVIWFDVRGNGASAAPEDWESVTLGTLADDIDAIRDATGTERVFLYGHSYGGFLALTYALRYPERLDGLMLASTAAHLGHPPNIPPDAPQSAVEAFSSLFEAPMPSDEQWEHTWRAAFPLYAPELDATAAERANEKTVFRAAAWNRGLALLADYDVSGRLSEIATPTLLLSGAKDFITGTPAHEEMCAAIPKAELEVFEEAGHFPFLTAPREYRTAARTWLERQPEPPVLD